METSPSTEAPIACTLDAGEFNDRLAWIAEPNRAALLDARREGPRLVVTYRPDHAERVREMVRRERQCCGFLDFDLREDRGGVRLVIKAPKGAVDALDAIFQPFTSGSARTEGCSCAGTSIRKGANDDGC